MKRIFVYAAVIVSVMFTSCEEHKAIPVSEVPPAAVSAFNAKYPLAANVKWITEDKKGKKIYEAQFQLENQNFEAEFDEAGGFILEH